MDNVQENFNLRQKLEEIFRPVHDNVEIRERNGVFTVNWPCCNDSERRPHKRSKTIVIKLSDEVMDDIMNNDLKENENTLLKIEKIIEKKLKNFDGFSNHNRWEEPEKVIWSITTKEVAH